MSEVAEGAAGMRRAVYEQVHSSVNVSSETCLSVALTQTQSPALGTEPPERAVSQRSQGVHPDTGLVFSSHWFYGTLEMDSVLIRGRSRGRLFVHGLLLPRPA